MPFNYDASGIEEDRFTRSVLPAGWYELKIVEANEKTSSKGDNMVSTKCMVAEPFEYAGRHVYHNVTFLDKGSKGAGMAIHFLKCIGEPYENSFQVNAHRWIGKRFRAKVIEAKFDGRPKNEIKEVSPMDVVAAAKDDEVPF